MKKTLTIILGTIGLSLAALPVAQADNLQNGSTETTGQYMSASAITAKVKTALLSKKNLDSTRIKVQSETVSNNPDKYIVILTGTQKSQNLVDLAGLTVKEVDGVTKVINKLTVAP